MYAFFEPPAVPSEGWRLYNPAAEFKRQGVGSASKAWRFSTINTGYEMIPTYPALLVVPAHISDSTLTYAAKYRSKARIPALTYLHWSGHGSITRCSQPMVGLKQNRSVQDEKLIEAIFATHRAANGNAPGPVYGATPTNLIIDARPTTNAMANIAKGAGTENMENYRNCKKVYLGVDNIHVMRDSLNRAVLVLRADARSALEGHEPQPVDQLALRRSNWLKHLGAILDGTLLIVRNVHINASHVLVHCSDGWDRTAQLTSLAALCLDPYYRTLHGFAVLIEKDWLSFGHRFQDRSGLVGLGADKFDMTVPQNEPLFDADGQVVPIDDTLVETGGNSSFWGFTKHITAQFQGSAAQQRAPIFHQFLDCVAQLQAQFPERFAFNGAFLAVLLRHVYAGDTGTFLYNTERERCMPRANGMAPVDCTRSVWDLLFQDEVVGRWANPQYNPALDDRDAPGGDMGVLFPATNHLRFSSDLFCRPYTELNSRLDAEAEERKRLQERLAHAGREAKTDVPRHEPDAFDEQLQAATTRMRSLFSDGWGRVQGAMRSAGLEQRESIPAEAVAPASPPPPPPPARVVPANPSNPWAYTPPRPKQAETPPPPSPPPQAPPGTTADPLGAWQDS